MLSRQTGVDVYREGGGIAVVPTPRLLSTKTPHPTRERGAGQRTDLAFPNAPEDDERVGGA